MGLRDLGKRLRASIDELDDQRLQDRFAGLGLSGDVPELRGDAARPADLDGA